MLDQQLIEFDKIVINTSGGKDSLVMMKVVVDQCERLGIKDRILAVHCNLKDMEWPGTLDLVKEQCELFGIPLKVLTRTIDLLEAVRRRGKWPDSKNRYCTSQFKRDHVATVFTELNREVIGGSANSHDRRYVKKDERIRILNCMGIRAQESAARRQRPYLARNNRSSTKNRTVWDWNPILDMEEKQVWKIIKSHNLPYHWAYDKGMPRLSCMLCIFASKGALMIAGKANPELLDRYVAMEEKIGHKFTHKMAISEVRDAIQRGEKPKEVKVNT